MRAMLFISILALLSVNCSAQSLYTVYGTVKDTTDPSKVLQGVVIVKGQGNSRIIEKNSYRLDSLKPGAYQLYFDIWGYEVVEVSVEIKGKDVVRDIIVTAPYEELSVVRITADHLFESGKLSDITGVSIFASKKTEMVIPSPVSMNLATNSSRQMFRSIPGLNIWESDAGGLQLGIGARGLNPNRASNFNTRQNGYDISADALGYPESYYTPPSAAVKRVEVVRGAASLQYGPQFGGLLNFVLDDGPDDIPFQINGSATYGSFGFFQSYNHITLNKGKWKYNAGFQYKKGNGFRPNSDFNQRTLIAMISGDISERAEVRFEFSHMYYLAHQPGGLLDYQFRQDPAESYRARNWFEVNWNLASATLDYHITHRLKFRSTVWGLIARRSSVGELGGINRPDPMRERDLIKGSYRNIGWENRFLYRYRINKMPSSLSFGTRTYFGFTINRQGYGTAGCDPDFEYPDPDTPGISEYRFPGMNHALYAENMVHLNRKWTLTPGVRLEYIRTTAKGYFINRVWSGDQVIFEKRYSVHKVNPRAFPLFGVGLSYRMQPTVEMYGNVSQNYRSINFSDLTVSNPNLVIDSALSDESGFNADLGIRGTIGKNRIRFDAGLFYLRYNNRIGITEIEILRNGSPYLVPYRTNIGIAATKGLEGYMEWNLKSQFRAIDSCFSSCALFVNGSVMDGRYISGRSEYVGNRLEFVPELNVKVGLNVGFRNVFVSWQLGYTGIQFSDATNALLVSDATRGVIPAYMIHDLNLGYEIRNLIWKLSITNLSNESYFTRRALSYPGPGIIPAEPRSFYLTLIYKFKPAKLFERGGHI